MAKVRSPGTLHKGQLPKREQQMSLADARAPTTLDALHRCPLFKGLQMPPTLPPFLRTSETAMVLGKLTRTRTGGLSTWKARIGSLAMAFWMHYRGRVSPSCGMLCPGPLNPATRHREQALESLCLSTVSREHRSHRASHPGERLRTWVERCPFTKGRSLGVKGFTLL